MNLPPALTDACRAGRLLLLWGALPWPLDVRPPANPALALNRWHAADGALPSLAFALHRLPPLPVLSLDPSERVARAFERAGVPLQVVLTRHDVPVRGRHTLLKLAGDLETRRGVILSRAALRELRADRDKRYLLDEARRVAEGGAVLLLGADPGDEDFRAWWAVLGPVFRDAALFAVGAPEAAWPEGMTCLGMDGAALRAALRAAAPEPEDEEAIVKENDESKYNIHIENASGLVIGDHAQVDQIFQGAGARQAGEGAAAPDPRLAPLRRLLNQRMSLQELRTCCFDLGVDFENLGGEGKVGRLESLLAHLAGREALPRLIDWLRQNRPDMNAALDGILKG